MTDSKVDPLPWETEEDAEKRVANQPSLHFPPTNTKCSVCGEPQFESPSGAVCGNGHGGAPGEPIVLVNPKAADLPGPRHLPLPAGHTPFPVESFAVTPSPAQVEALKAIEENARNPKPHPLDGKSIEDISFRGWDRWDDDAPPKPKASLAPDPPALTLSKDQAVAMDGIMAWWKQGGYRGTKTLGGYAGTGKTTIMGRLAYNLLNEGVNVAFATPTGKAAQVLERSLSKAGVWDAGVSTVHGLIYRPDMDPETGRIRGWKRQRNIDYDLIVVDEASMVSQQMLDDLQSFGKPILAIGDHGQLPPVGEKAGLMANPDFRLEKIHRQAKGNPIIRLATLIRNGAPNEAIRAFIEDQNDERVQIGSKDDGKKFGAPPGMLITYTNRLRTGLNHQLRHDLFGYDEEVDPQVGEIVICLKNYRLDENGLMIANGMRGEVVGCQEDQRSSHHYEMSIQFDEPVGLVTGLRVNKHQFLKENTFKGFDEVPGNHSNWWSVGALFDFGYALTCHKAQGSQADQVSVHLEWAMGRMSDEDQRRWKYTAVTRAAERLMMVF